MASVFGVSELGEGLNPKGARKVLDPVATSWAACAMQTADDTKQVQRLCLLRRRTGSGAYLPKGSK